MKTILNIKTLIIIFGLFALIPVSYAQKDKNREKDFGPIEKSLGIYDRAGGLHNASNLGLFFENRGKLYPRRLSQGPSLEFPINSGKQYLYRGNIFIGIPGNVVQGRFTTNEEWEAAYGYHNRQLAKIAFSDNPNSWGPNGWPVKDADGNPIIKSDQDSYCVYNDSTNALGALGIEVHQIGYAYGVNFAKNLLFFKYMVVNKGSKTLDSLYFSKYFDVDVGNISGGDPEYADDRVGFDRQKNFVWYYDDGVSNEWPGGKTGMVGLVFLKTPVVNGKELGITDFHYSLYDDDSDIDSVQYGIMSSNRNLYNSNIGNKYFHIGSGSDIHFDDPNTIPASGMDLVTYNSSGPYTLPVNDTLVFYTAFVAGETKAELDKYLNEAFRILQFDFEISKPPITPTLNVFSGDKKALLYWDDKAEASKDNYSGEYDFEGYRVYRSLDKGVNWQLLQEYDIPKNQIGADRGLQYSYTDTTVTNGIEYWYCVTAYDRGDSSVPSLESPKGTSINAQNTKAAVPRTEAIGRTAVTGDQVLHTGPGNYPMTVNPVDNDSLAGNSYKVGFTYTSRQEIGKPIMRCEIIINDSSKTEMNKWGIQWTGPKTFWIIDYRTGDPTSQAEIAYANGKLFPIIKGPNANTPALGFRLFGPAANAPIDSLPRKDDLLTISFSNRAVRNGSDTVIHPRPVDIDLPQATSDGVVFTMMKKDVIEDVSRVGGTDNITIDFTVSDETMVKNEHYLVSVNKNGKSDGQGFVEILVRGAAQDTVLRADSLFNLGTFNFNGIQGRLTFPAATPPSPGNIFAVKSVIPKAPNLMDTYSFSILGSKYDRVAAERDKSKIRVVPNPYVVSSLFEPEFGELRREPLRRIQFINLPVECSISIFTVDADLVKTIQHSSTSGTAEWDLRAEGGREIAPGIYLFVVKAEGFEYLSRFAVIK